MALSVVVTGASGFVGSALVKKLRSSRNFEVIPVSRSTVNDSYINVDNYRETPAGDVLVHLAENSDRTFVNEAGEDYINESGEILDSLIANRYGKIIYCSSSSVYGDRSNKPVTEESPVYFDDNYTRLKLTNEQKIISTGGIVARLSNVVGPGMATNNVLSDILLQVHEGAPITVKKEDPVRDFVWINDVVSALEVLISKAESGIFNVGTGKGVSIKELAEIVLNAVGQAENVKSLSISRSLSYNVLDIGKMRQLLNWSPKLTLSQSIKLMI
ncbi:MAG: hypothetical protein CL402_00105 [Acidiferrobacteraceae bacterium]|nr:hypothetical protein [Acidiferrobacteraceae bacterium]|tara:strand:+ start:443 stop:1258 length:816 start_codon:yes stop_codon:yes gene_type:complete